MGLAAAAGEAVCEGGGVGWGPEEEGLVEQCGLGVVVMRVLWVAVHGQVALVDPYHIHGAPSRRHQEAIAPPPPKA